MLLSEAATVAVDMVVKVVATVVNKEEATVVVDMVAVKAVVDMVAAKAVVTRARLESANPIDPKTNSSRGNLLVHLHVEAHLVVPPVALPHLAVANKVLIAQTPCSLATSAKWTTTNSLK